MMDDLLFDVDADLNDAPPPTNFLIVPACAESSEALNVIEARYRREGLPPIIFVDDDGVLENAPEMARAMKLPAGMLPTLEEAEAFMAAWQVAGKAPASW